MNAYDNDNDNRVFWAAAVWTTVWLSCIVGIFVVAINEARSADIQPVTVLSSDTHYIPQPPPQYRGVPGNYLMFFMPQEAVAGICDVSEAVGCTQVWPDNPDRPCIIAIDENAGDLMHQIMTHEYGHCNGWPASHPDARMP